MKGKEKGAKGKVFALVFVFAITLLSTFRFIKVYGFNYLSLSTIVMPFFLGLLATGFLSVLNFKKKFTLKGATESDIKNAGKEMKMSDHMTNVAVDIFVNDFTDEDIANAYVITNKSAKNYRTDLKKRFEQYEAFQNKKKP